MKLLQRIIPWIMIVVLLSLPVALTLAITESFNEWSVKSKTALSPYEATRPLIGQKVKSVKYEDDHIVLVFENNQRIDITSTNPNEQTFLLNVK